MISQDHSIVHDAPAPAANSSSRGSETETSTESPLALIDQRMRGRWRLAIGLGVVLGAVVATVGYRQAVPMYQSVGSLHVAPRGQAIIYDTPDSRMVPRIDGLMKTLAETVNSPQTIETALADPMMADLADVLEPGAVQQALDVDHTRGSELIRVSYVSTSPEEAQRVLAAVLSAFEDNEGWQGNSANRQLKRQQQYETRAKFEKQLEVASRTLREFKSAKLSRAAVEPILESKLTWLEQLELELANLEYQLSVLTGAVDPVAPPAMTEQQAIEADAGLRAIVEEREAVSFALEQALELYNPRHMQVMMLERALVDVDRRYESALPRALSAHADESQFVVSGSEEELERSRTHLVDRIDSLSKEVEGLFADSFELDRLQKIVDDVEKELATINTTISRAEIEDEAIRGGEINVREAASMPWGEYSDKRAKYAAAGFVAGFMMSMGLFFLLGTLDRRTFAASQLSAADGEYSCLGVLPDLGGKLDGSDMPETASQCIHQIRNRLESFRSPGASYMIVVSSPYQGDGKTSLAMSLAWSYAMGGHRTVLVDCDFHGRNLTAQMGLSGQAGLKEALRSRHLNGEVQSLGVENLSGLGVGLDPTFGPESIKRDDFLSLCNGLRGNFDIIVADTGPFIGSVELLPVAAASDGVIFPVRRGRSRARLGECISELNSIRIPCLGVVLNRAGQADCARYISQSTVSRRSLVDDAGRTPSVSDNLLVSVMSSAVPPQDDAPDGEIHG